MTHQNKGRQTGEIGGCHAKCSSEKAAKDFARHEAGNVQAHKHTKHCGLNTLQGSVPNFSHALLQKHASTPSLVPTFGVQPS
jgi:hypothetical protein